MTEHKRILIVEDEAITAMELELRIAEMGYRVAGIAESAQQAMELCGTEKPDLILMDIVMPGEMDGIDAAALIRKRYNIPFIYLTAYTDLETIQRAGRTEPYGYIVKPFDVRELNSNIQIALYRHEMEMQTRHDNPQLQAAMHGMLDTIDHMVELKDPLLQGHQRMTAALAAAIATEMGLDENMIESVHACALVHDAGLVGVPFEIINNTIRSKAEQSLFLSHTTMGHDLFKHLNFPWPLADVALGHHERLDGSGYPNGLSGEQISQENRIIGVADVVVTEARKGGNRHSPYSEHSIHRALEEIEQGRARQYDPQVVDACLRLFRDRAYQLR